MKKQLLLLLIFALTCCENVEQPTNKEVRIWKPEPISIIGNQMVKLRWYNHVLYEEILLPYNFVNPDKFEIYSSENIMNDFQMIANLVNDKSYEYTIENLQNGRVYYYYIISKKDGFSPLYSDTIMVIPNPEPVLEEIINMGDKHSIASISFAKDRNKIAYVDLFYRWNGGKDCCMSSAVFISSFDGSDAELIDIKSYEPDWSPDNNSIVFRTEKGLVNLGDGIPSQIALFDYKTKAITNLIDNQGFNYNPTFSNDGFKILFQSSINSPYKYSTDIWVFDLLTLEKEQITNLLNNGLIDAGFPNWINDEEFLFHGELPNNFTNIFKSSIKTKQMTSLFKSQWNDFCPSISRNGKLVAFITNRSGNNQIWIYNLEAGQYKQLTGYDPHESLDQYWNKIEWLDDSNILFSSAGDRRLMKLRIE